MRLQSLLFLIIFAAMISSSYGFSLPTFGRLSKANTRAFKRFLRYINNRKISTKSPHVWTETTKSPHVWTETTESPHVWTETTESPHVWTETTESPFVWTESTESTPKKIESEKSNPTTVWPEKSNPILVWPEKSNPICRETIWKPICENVDREVCENTAEVCTNIEKEVCQDVQICEKHQSGCADKTETICQNKSGFKFCWETPADCSEEELKCEIFLDCQVLSVPECEPTQICTKVTDNVCVEKEVPTRNKCSKEERK